MNIQMYSIIWPYVLKCCALKLLWIFAFVIVCISGFLMLMFKSRKEDLKKSVLSKNFTENIHGKISDLKEGIKIKETKVSSKKRKTIDRKKIAKPRKRLSLINRRKALMNDIEKDALKMEAELAELESEIARLSKARERIKYEINKEQNEYKKCMQIFLEDEATR